jgi:Probable cobalt transporter subunit (CbtA)
VVANLIVRGLIVGILAGLLAFGWAKVFGEPAVDSAIGFESAQVVAAGQPDEPEIVSRGIQSTFGLMSGVVLIGAGLGAVFAILFALANGRIGSLGPQQTSVLLAVMTFVSIYLVPALKYPPNPPSVGEPETIKFRTATYFLLMAISVGASIGAWPVRQRLIAQYGSWYASLLAAAAYAVVIGVAFLILPNVNEVPDGFPAVTLYDFRLASIGIQAVLWGALGVIFGYVVEHTMDGVGSSAKVPPRRPVVPSP